MRRRNGKAHGICPQAISSRVCGRCAPRSRSQIFTWRNVKTATSPFVYMGSVIFLPEKPGNRQCIMRSTKQTRTRKFDATGMTLASERNRLQQPHKTADTGPGRHHQLNPQGITQRRDCVCLRFMSIQSGLRSSCSPLQIIRTHIPLSHNSNPKRPSACKISGKIAIKALLWLNRLPVRY